MKKITISFLAISLLMIIACKPSNEENTTAASQYIEQAVPNDFMVFYDQFHADSTFQLSHINFPLSGMNTDSTQNMASVPYIWTKEQWRPHKKFDERNGTFNRDFTNFNGLVIEHITSNNGQFGMERRFTKLENQWMLIYYSSMKQM